MAQAIPGAVSTVSDLPERADLGREMRQGSFFLYDGKNLTVLS
jgi:hypothetical protein